MTGYDIQMKIKIAPSILSADFGKINEEIKEVEPYADLIHVDVMDGHFVPNITIGVPFVAALKSNLPFEVHLMIEHPDKFVDAFVDALKKSKNNDIKKCILTVHQEACGDKLPEVLKKIRERGLLAGVSINPDTPLSTITPYLDYIDYVLIMTVNPGFGGQKFIESALSKVSELRAHRPELDIAVDGGINAETAAKAVKAGVNVLVAGSYIFHADNMAAAIDAMRKL